MWRKLQIVLFAGLVSAVLMAGGLFATTHPAAAQTPATETGSLYGEDSDPLEPVNRVLFAIHDGVDIVALRPVAYIYNRAFPQFVRNGVSNFLSNLASPITFVNDILQGEIDRAGTTLVRFLINTTVGFGGVGDAAAMMGHAPHYEDFGQTMAVWGIGTGPYLFVPIIGPTTLRHAVGRVVDTALSPWTWLLYNEPTYIALIPAGVTLLSARSENLEALDNLRETSPDYYASIRNLYFQNRNYEINNGNTLEDLEDIPDY